MKIRNLLTIADVLGLHKLLSGNSKYEDVEIINIPESDGLMQIKVKKKEKK